MSVDQILAFGVAGSFVVLSASAVGFFVGRGAGRIEKMVLVSILVAVGLTNDASSVIAEAVETFAIATTAATIFVLIFPPTGILADYRPQDLFSLTGSYWLVLTVGGAVVLIATITGLAIGAREYHTARNGGGSEQYEISSVYPWEDR